MRFVDLPRLLGAELDRFPYLMRILIENVVRHSPEDPTIACRPFHDWLARGRSEAEIEFMPGRILMHDTTCVPALVDIAAMRASLAEMGRDPQALNPMLPVDVSVDHSVGVDSYGSAGSLAFNMAREIDRNAERYRLLKWATNALDHVTVHPPGTGIMHTMNLEQLSTVISEIEVKGVRCAVPDTLIGTDSHTPMVNGIGVLAWGVGGLEAESVMFGMPVSLRIPDIVGVRLDGKLPEGVLSTDLVLTVTQRLRAHGIAGEFVEFYGPGVSTLSAGDRAVVANMAPEYGASSGYFPIDAETIRYLRSTGRDRNLVERVEAAARGQGLWFQPDGAPRYTDVIEIDLSRVTVSLAGPRRPQDRVEPGQTREILAQAVGHQLRNTSDRAKPPDGAVAIAAITSCTNTSDPRLTVAAGLLARKARQRGLKPPSWVKTSFAPGSPAAGRYLARAGLLEDLSAVGFDIVGHGCTTCIGNSGPLEASMDQAVGEGVVAAAALSGNRNFPGRVHPKLEFGFLMSPPLVVAYALAGDVARDILTDPIAERDGVPIRLADLWPSGAEIDAAMALAAAPEDYRSAFVDAEASPAWDALEAPCSVLFPWDEASTYLRRPPFASAGKARHLSRYVAHPLIVLGDDITTDHISPAGAIPEHGEAGTHLVARGADPHDLNVFASRRGNWEVMLRGLFTNRGVRNLLAPGLQPGETIHVPTGATMPLWRAAERYREDDIEVVVVAGERYGTGSSRDWAAKGLNLLGVRAVLANSFERIHRSNLVAMGILPVMIPDHAHPARLDLRPGDRIEVQADMETLVPRGPVAITVLRKGGAKEKVSAHAAVETQAEIDLLRFGGVIPSLLRPAQS